MPHTAFLLAAGFGTRLRPLTEHRPKAMLPVCGVPMLDHALAHVRAFGHKSVLVNAHHQWEKIAAWAEANGVALQVESPEVLGTGGALRAALDDLDAVVNVVNADILTNTNLAALRADVMPDGAAMLLREHFDDAARFGPVERNAQGEVVRIVDIVGEPGIPGTHFTGIHAISKDAVARIPEGPQCVLRTAYRELVPKGQVRASFQSGLSWFDVGTPGAYLDANLAVLHGHFRTSFDVWRRGARVYGNWVGTGAEVRGHMERSVIGAGAVVPEGARLHDCVVWDGVTVPEGSYHRAILYDGGVLQI